MGASVVWHQGERCGPIKDLAVEGGKQRANLICLVRGEGVSLWTACGGSDGDVSTQRCQDLDGIFDTLSADVGVCVGIWGYLCG